jgi:hypothetical protein
VGREETEGLGNFLADGRRKKEEEWGWKALERREVETESAREGDASGDNDEEARGGVGRRREERARGRRGGLEETGRPRHLPGQLQVLGFTGCDTGCRCTPSRSSDPLNLPVPSAMQLPIAVSLRDRWKLPLLLSNHSHIHGSTRTKSRVQTDHDVWPSFPPDVYVSN